jgi:hypothetical protein
MKKTIFLPLFFILIFVFIVSTACNLSTTKESTETAEPKVIVVTATPAKESNVVNNTATKAPTEEEMPVVTEEVTPDNEAQPYFIEEFDGTLDNYSFDVYGPGNHDDVEIKPEDGVLKFIHSGPDVYSYVYYDAYTYDDVRIDVEAENLATNDNSVNIMCRYDPDKGWYEYDIDNDGQWNLWYYDAEVAQGYTKLYDGGSTAINMGRDTNLYTVICQGNELSLYINGKLTRTVENKNIKRGEIGFGVSSYDSYPVKINVNWLQISEP